jgi:rod shape-determining protein MreD
MPASDVAKAALLVFFAVLVQASVVGAWDLAGSRPDVLLVVIVCVALLRGPIVGACVGFAAGLLVDLATFETLGLTSLLLTLAGYWTGRYGETTGRDRVHAPVLSVVVVTALYGLGAYALHTILGEAVSARTALVTALLPAIAYNALLTVPLFPLVRRLLRPYARVERAREVQLLG